MWDFRNIGGVSVSSCFFFYHRFKSFALFIALRNTAYSTSLTVKQNTWEQVRVYPTHLLSFFIASQSISHHSPAAQTVVSLYWDLSGYLPTSQIIFLRTWRRLNAKVAGLMERKWTSAWDWALRAAALQPTREAEVWEKRIWMEGWKWQRREVCPRGGDSATLALTSLSIGH